MKVRTNRLFGRVGLLLEGLLTVCVLAQFMPRTAVAQPAPELAVANAEEGVRWSGLSAQNKGLLAPLQDQWPALSSSTKEKWIGVAKRMSAMQPEERERIQGRMASWASLTPVERGQARLYFQEARQLSPEARAEQWKRYSELSEDEKRQLAARAVPPSATRSVSSLRNGKPLFSVSDSQAGKMNTTPALPAALPQRVAPSVIQVQPGATTTLISSRPNPPAHQPAGMPKIGKAPTPSVPASTAAAAQPKSQSNAEVPDQP